MIKDCNKLLLLIKYVMYQLLPAILNGDEKAALEQLILSLNTADKRYFLRNEILQAFTVTNPKSLFTSIIVPP